MGDVSTLADRAFGPDTEAGEDPDAGDSLEVALAKQLLAL